MKLKFEKSLNKFVSKVSLGVQDQEKSPEKISMKKFYQMYNKY